jgi:hypothetical protein
MPFISFVEALRKLEQEERELEPRTSFLARGTIPRRTSFLARGRGDVYQPVVEGSTPDPSVQAPVVEVA